MNDTTNMSNSPFDSSNYENVIDENANPNLHDYKSQSKLNQKKNLNFDRINLSPSPKQTEKKLYSLNFQGSLHNNALPLQNKSISKKRNGSNAQVLFKNIYKEDKVSLITPEYQHNFRHARKLYIGNIPENVTEQCLCEWFYRCMEATEGLLESGNPIIELQLEKNNKYAFLELRSIEETTALTQLDGIIMWNRQLRIRRPSEYEKYPRVMGTRPVPTLEISHLEQIGIKIISTFVEESDDKIFLANLPSNLDDLAIIKNLGLQDEGILKAFHLVKDFSSEEVRQYAFFDLTDKSQTDRYIDMLDGLKLNGRTLICRRSNEQERSAAQQKKIQNQKQSLYKHQDPLKKQIQQKKPMILNEKKIFKEDLDEYSDSLLDGMIIKQEDLEIL